MEKKYCDFLNEEISFYKMKKAIIEHKLDEMYDMFMKLQVDYVITEIAYLEKCKIEIELKLDGLYAMARNKQCPVRLIKTNEHLCNLLADKIGLAGPIFPTMNKRNKKKLDDKDKK